MIKVGYIPEHFSTPLQFAKLKGYFTAEELDLELIPYPSGSGHLIQSLNSNEIDIAIGLTEAFVRGIVDTDPGDKPKYQIVGTYVKSPLNWAVSTGISRNLHSLDELEGGKIGVSRIGSGSYVMSFVLALQKGFQRQFSDYPVCNTFANLRQSVNSGDSDAFMWEYFTTKKYYDSKEIKMLGNIYTPWPSWVVVKHRALDSVQLDKFANAVNRGIKYFGDHPEESIEYIYKNLDYSKEDATEWLKTVEFHDNIATIHDKEAVLKKTLNVLQTAKVLKHTDSSTINTNLANGVYGDL